jgi:hypothetical protein
MNRWRVGICGSKNRITLTEDSTGICHSPRQFPVHLDSLTRAAPGCRLEVVVPYHFVVRVEFYKMESHGRQQSAWRATRGKRTRIPGTVMAGGTGIPHDLAQYVIEAATGYRGGFWDLVSKGATFKSSGRRRTKPGRAVIAEHRHELAGAERLAGEHLERWKAGETSPVSRALNLALDQWSELSLAECLIFVWPSASAEVGPRDGED